MRTVQLTLKTYLESHGLSAYRLAEAAKGRVSRGTVYSLARGDASRIDLSTLGAVITTLEELTGQEVTPADLLSAVTVSPAEQEHLEWDAAELTQPLPPYDWGEAGEPEGEPVRYIVGRGFVVGEA